MPEKKGVAIENILAAARKEFADKGFEGARVDEIARKACVNKAMLYYHIGDKHELYAQVLHSIIGNVVEQIEKELEKVDKPEDKLRTYIAVFNKAIASNPEMPRIMMREIASGGNNLPDIFFKDILRIISIITGVIKAGTKSGVFIETIPELVHVMVMGGIISTNTIFPLLYSKNNAPGEIRNICKKTSSHIASEIERLVMRSVLVYAKRG
ncbi:MAG TPA: TetR/AcrR family transcriptional regulator [Desulfomonilia bacterium]